LGINLLAHVMCAQITSNERLLLTTPLPHSAGFFLQAAMLQGATTWIEPKFDPVRLLQLVERNSISWTFLVPTQIYRLLSQLQNKKTRTESIRTIVYGAAPILKSQIELAIDCFGPVFLQLYGQSECPNFVTMLSKDDHSNEALLTSCGQACPTADVRIANAGGEELAIGEVGELQVRSSYTMQEYYTETELTEAAFDGDWLRTGDVEYQNESGHIFIVDRTKDLIISGGMNVYSKEVEEVLVSHPNIHAAAVIGVPDADWGEAVHAFIVVDEAPDPADVKTYCDSKLGKYKTPKSFCAIESLPTTPYGKIDKKALRVLFGEKHQTKNSTGMTI